MDILFDQDYITRVVQKEIRDDAKAEGEAHQKAKDDAERAEERKALYKAFGREAVDRVLGQPT